MEEQMERIEDQDEFEIEREAWEGDWTKEQEEAFNQTNTASDGQDGDEWTEERLMGLHDKLTAEEKAAIAAGAERIEETEGAPKKRRGGRKAKKDELPAIQGVPQARRRGGSKKAQQVAAETAAMAQASKPARASEAAKEIEAPAPRYCLCGCGGIVKGKKAHFKPGHDARAYSMLLKVEKGEAEADTLPEGLAKIVVPCAKCGRPIMPHESGMGPICRKRS
jgi:hypothetical protein